MARRFLLVGLLVVWPYEQGQVMQLAFGCILAMGYLMLQAQAMPYRSGYDNNLAIGCSFMLCVLLNCCVFYKYVSLTDISEIQARMSFEQRVDYRVTTVSLTSAFIGCSFGALVFTTVLLLAQLELERIKKAHVRRLLYLGGTMEVPVPQAFSRSGKRREEMVHGGLYRKDASGTIVDAAMPLPTAGPFHLFLSHSMRKRDSAPHALSAPAPCCCTARGAPLNRSETLVRCNPLFGRLETRSRRDAHHQEGSSRDASWAIRLP